MTFVYAHKGIDAIALVRRLVLTGGGAPKGPERVPVARERSGVLKYLNEQQGRHVKKLTTCFTSAIGAASDGSSAAKESQEQEPTSNVGCMFEFVTSTREKPIECAILTTVPHNSVLVRPTGACDFYVSVEALNAIAATNPSSLAHVFPGVALKDVDWLHSRSSFLTCLVSRLAKGSFPRFLAISSSAALLIASRHVLQHLGLYVLLCGVLWMPQVYSLWHGLYHSPVPLLILSIYRALLGVCSFIDVFANVIKDEMINLESRLLNFDLQRVEAIPATTLPLEDIQVIRHYELAK